MSLRYSQILSVHHNECDLHGWLQEAHYLRYFENVAFAASAAAGYGEEQYNALRRSWLIRETTIEFGQRLRFGDSVQASSWVADFRRVRSRRAYELRHLGSGSLAARGHTDWVFLDLDTGRPAAIPEELISAFMDVGEEPGFQSRERFPTPPLPPSNLFTCPRRVVWSDLDRARHVNNAVYLQLIEDASRQLLAFRGWPVARVAGQGLSFASQQHRIEYRQQALPDEDLSVAVWFSAARPLSVLRHATISRLADGELLAQVVSHWHGIDPDSGEPKALPAPLLAILT